VSVSPSIDELLLGCDWLTKQKGQWDFATGIVRLGNIEVRTRPKRAPEIASKAGGGGGVHHSCTP